jgi:hypothetical protein
MLNTMQYQNIMKKVFSVALIALIISGTLPTSVAYAAPACTLTAGAGEIVVNFDGTSLLSSTTPNRTAQTASIPAGTYTITAVTWDNHTGTTETDQTTEKVRFIFKDTSGEITLTAATIDIPANQNFATTTLGSYIIGRNATSVVAEHARIGDSNYQSVTPLCIKLTGSSTNTLAVSCRVSDATIEEGDTVDFTADVTGGVSPFSYDWDWDIDGNSRNESHRFNNSGNYRARVTVTDNAGRTAQGACPTIRVDNDNGGNNGDDLEISCRVSDTTIEEGDTVTYSVDINDGNSPYDIEWDGDISGDNETERVRYNRNGSYEVEVTVRDDNGDRDTDTCPVVRVSDNNGGSNNNNSNINVITHTNNTHSNTPIGNFASLDTVFLSQVPYTGPEDIARIAGVLAFIAIWSTGAALYFRKRRALQATSLKIEAFKATNKTTASIQ